MKYSFFGSEGLEAHKYYTDQVQDAYMGVKQGYFGDVYYSIYHFNLRGGQEFNSHGGKMPHKKNLIIDIKNDVAKFSIHIEKCTHRKTFL